MSGDDVQVHLFAAARAAIGSPVVVVTAGTLTSIVAGLVDQHPAFAEVSARCSFLIDGLAAHDRDVEIAAGSRLDVLPPFAGG